MLHYALLQLHMITATFSQASYMGFVDGKAIMGIKYFMEKDAECTKMRTSKETENERVCGRWKMGWGKSKCWRLGGKCVQRSLFTLKITVRAPQT